jgi:peptidoglycan hydrolase-like protein with peptidoglycan-binding domain
MAQLLTWLPETLLDAGLQISRVDGWEDRGRPGAFGPIKGVICHHTVGLATGNMPSLNTLIHGRAASKTAKALSGPLAQLGLGRDGTYYIVAAGRANHAGDGAWHGDTAGNTHFIGIEAEHTGDPATPWPEIQLDAYKRGVAAILKKIGASAEMCCGHKEWTRRKPDPTRIDMDDFRREVAAMMGGELRKPLIPARTEDGKPTLRRGAKGAAVNTLQQALGVKVDGDFGPRTEAAVRQWQRDHGLAADGIVGPKSWAKLSGG